MGYIESAGLRAGVDVAITGFDDLPLSEHLRPPLTSLRQPIELLARQVIDLLIAEIARRRLPEHQILLAPTLIVRASSSQPLHC
jgi:DNA-binding LacI/PurR family transcriptional regulator